MVENVADVLVRVQRPDRRGADEALEIDQELASVRGERGEGSAGKSVRVRAQTSTQIASPAAATAWEGVHGSPTAFCHMIRCSPS